MHCTSQSHVRNNGHVELIDDGNSCFTQSHRHQHKHHCSHHYNLKIKVVYYYLSFCQINICLYSVLISLLLRSDTQNQQLISQIEVKTHRCCSNN